jgi:FMN reductase
MARYLVVSTSGNPDSNSRRMGRIAFRNLEKANVPCAWLDISELELPLCDADTCYAKPGSQTVGKAIKASDGILLATPVYNYDVSAAAKNLVELTGSAWEDKVVGFLCAAGGMSSYMSVMAFANSLMLDFRCVIIPRFVYATGRAFEGDELKDKEVDERIAELTAELVRFTQRLRG